MSSGIYSIINTETVKLYIGSSNNLERRQRTHFNLLRKNKHANAHLQNAWNKYGENSFIFQIVESCTKDSLLEREQFWINLFTLDNLYNICPEAGKFTRSEAMNRKFKNTIEDKINNGEISCSKSFELLSPDNKIIIGKNIRKFCRDNNLGQSEICKVINGKRIEHKGWKLPNNTRVSRVAPKSFIIKSPDNIVGSFTNVRDFARENNLDHSGICKVLNGKLKSHKGWTKA